MTVLRILNLTGILLICLFATAHGANRTPTTGIVSGAVDRDFISYECRSSGRGTLDCKFAQVKIRTAAQPEDLAKRLKRIDKLQRDLSRSNAKQDCERMAPLLGALKTGRPPKGADTKKFKEMMSRLHPKELEDQVGFFERYVQACRQPTADNIERMVRAEHSKQMRTCKVLVNNYEQTFQRTGDGKWVHNNGPTGPCGVIYISVFEPESPKGPFYNYVTRKVVTNKSGQAGLVACKLLDETVQKYTWKTETFYRGCDYITYGL